MKSINIKIIIITLLFFPANILGYCSQVERNEFDKVKDKYYVTQEYDKETGIYKVEFHYVLTERFMYDSLLSYKEGEFGECLPTNNFTFICTTKDADKFIEYKVKGNTSACNEILKTERVILKKPKEFNEYSNSELCEGIEDFVLCQEGYLEDISKEEFEERVEVYKNNKDKNSNKDIEDNNKDKKKNEILDVDKINWRNIIVYIISFVMIVSNIFLEIKLFKKRRSLE